ncbi:MAG: hypothetical protein IJK26_10235 [Clostridia bacterium]|nr:hypothetical protein [Clostridia bacterium]
MSVYVLLRACFGVIAFAHFYCLIDEKYHNGGYHFLFMIANTAITMLFKAAWLPYIAMLYTITTITLLIKDDERK